MVFEISPQEIENLEPDKFVDFVNHLIEAECHRLGIPPTSVKVTSKITGKDRGVDARIEDSENRADGRWIPPGLNIWQFKTDKSRRNTYPRELRKEARKEGVQEALSEGAQYCVAIARICSDKIRKDREKALQEALREQDFDPNKVTLLTADELARWASEHPSLLLLPHFRRPIGGCMRVEQWERDELHQGDFIPDENRAAIMEKLRRFASSEESGVHMRIEGRRGVGKTRLVLEALKYQQLRERALYAQEPGQLPPELWAWLRDKTTTSAVLVVDECDEEEAIKLKAQADACEGRVKLITIGVGEPFLAEVAPNRFFLERLDDETTRQLLRARFPSLTNDQIAWIARLTAGYVRLAVACSEAFMRKPDIDVIQLAQAPEVRQVLRVLLPENTERKVMQALSLLRRVGVEEDVAQEGKTLAGFVGVDWHDFRSIAEEMYRRGLVGKKGRYRYVTPDLLASWLAADVWSARGDELIELIGNLPTPESRESFLERLKDLGTHEKAREVVQQLLSKEGLFRSIDHLDDEERAKLFHTLALADPASASRSLERLLGDCSVERLRSFIRGRRWIVWTLEYLKWFKETFFGAARLLLALAEAENETCANNATGVWVKMFQMGLGGTEVPAMDRLSLIEEALASDSSARRLLAVRAIAGVMSPRELRWTSSEAAGARPVPQEWRPKTWGEIWDVYRSALRLLDKAMRDADQEVARAARKAFLQSARTVVSIGLADEVLDRLERFTPRNDEEKRKARETIEGLLKYESDKLSEDQRGRLTAIERAITGASFHDRLHRWVGEWSFADWDAHERGEGPPPQDQAATLAEEAFKHPDLLLAELDWLTSPEARNVFYFGRRLGELDEEHKWLPNLVAKAREGKGVLLLASYLLGRGQAGEREWMDKLLDQWVESEPDLAATVLEVTRLQEPSSQGAKRLAQLVRKGWLEPKQLAVLMWGRWTEKLPIDAFEEILECLIQDQGQQATEAALSMVKERLKSFPDEKEKLAPLAWQLIERLSSLKGAITSQYLWGELAKLYASDDPLRVAEVILSEAGDTVFHQEDPPMQVLAHVTKLEPQRVWDKVAQVLLRKDEQSFSLYLSLRDWYITLFDVDQVLDWAEQHKPEGPRTIANLTCPTGIPLARLPRKLLICYGDDKSIGDSLYSNFTSGTFWGSMVTWLQKKLETAQKWASDPNQRVRQWAQAVVENLESEIRRAQKYEEEEKLRQL